MYNMLLQNSSSISVCENFNNEQLDEVVGFQVGWGNRQKIKRKYATGASGEGNRSTKI